MKTMSISRKLMIGAILGAALIVGGGLVSGTTAQAQVIWRGPRVIVPRYRVFWGYPTRSTQPTQGPTITRIHLATTPVPMR
jgi:hypothetical protein